jgi:hypothetical protein
MCYLSSINLLGCYLSNLESSFCPETHHYLILKDIHFCSAHIGVLLILDNLFGSYLSKLDLSYICIKIIYIDNLGFRNAKNPTKNSNKTSFTIITTHSLHSQANHSFITNKHSNKIQIIKNRKENRTYNKTEFLTTIKLIIFLTNLQVHY